MMSNNTAVPVIMKSEIPKETLRFTWNIADFAEVKESAELVDALSVTFEMGRSIGLPVTFKVYLEVDEEEIGCYSRLLNAPYGVEMVMAKSAIKIGDFLHEKSRTLKYNDECGHWGSPLLIPQNIDVSKLPLDANGALPIEITYTLYNTEGTSVALSDVMTKFELQFSRKLSEDMENLYKEPWVFDRVTPIVSVVARDGQEFSANWPTLAVRSPVFRQMFQTPMTETKKATVKIEDIGGEALEVFLHFMHTATLKDNWRKPGVLEELTYAAHKYLIQDLLDFLDETIGLVCPLDNCANMIRLVNRLELKKANEALLKMHQDQWKQATSVEQMINLFQK